MRQYGLIGRRLGHSFSKRYFTDKFRSEGIDACYSLYELDDIEEIKSLVINNNTLHGLNVTIPYKQSVIPYLDNLSKEAQAIGAVNCIAIADGQLTGNNTDVRGIEASLDCLDITSSYRAIVLGTGGAAKAVRYVLHNRGIEHIVVSRDASRGDYTYATLTPELIASHHLIINTTPAGMYPDIDTMPAIDLTAIGTKHRLFDLVYNPSPTLLMRKMKERGATVLGGGLMLKVQAEASWKIWNER